LLVKKNLKNLQKEKSKFGAFPIIILPQRLAKPKISILTILPQPKR